MVNENAVTPDSSEAGAASSTKESGDNASKRNAGVDEVPEYNRYRELDRKIGDLQSHVATLVDILSATQTKASDAPTSIDVDSLAQEDPVKAMRAIAAQTKQEILQETSKKDAFSKKQKDYDHRALTKYPDLNNPSSELWKMTDQVLKERKAEGLDPEKDPRAVLDAADAAFARLILEGKLSYSSLPSEQKRVKALSGGRTESSRGSGDLDDLDDNKLSPEQEFYAKKLGISKEAFLKRAKEGINWKHSNQKAKWGKE